MAYDPGLDDDIPEPKIWFTIRIGLLEWPFGPLEFWGGIAFMALFALAWWLA